MDTPVAALVAAASAVDAMGDKVAAFAIGQNLLWILAGLKNEIRVLTSENRGYFIGGSLVAGAFYALIECALGWHASSVLSEAGFDEDVLPAVLSSSHLLFALRAIGAGLSSLLAALAFWGTTRPGERATATRGE